MFRPVATDRPTVRSRCNRADRYGQGKRSGNFWDNTASRLKSTYPPNNSERLEPVRFNAQKRSSADHAASYAAHRHHRRRPGPCLRARGDCESAANLAFGRVSPGRRRCRTFDPGIRGGSRAGAGVGRNRRHSSDVRRGAALLAEGPSVGQGDRHSGGDRADHHRDLPRARHVVADGLVGGGGSRLRSGAFGRQYGRAPPRASGTPADRDRARAHRRRLADCRGSGDGARPRPAAGHGRPPGRSGRRCAHAREHRRTAEGACRHLRQGGGLRGDHARDRAPGDPLAPPLRRPYGFEGAVSAGRARDRAGRCLRLGAALRRILCARRVLRRDGPVRIGAEPSRRRGIPAAARRLRGAVLHLGRHAVRSGHRPRRLLGRDRGLPHHHRRQVAGGAADRSRLPASHVHGAHHFGQPCPDRRVLVHPRRPRGQPGDFAGARIRPHPRRGNPVDPRQSPGVRRARPPETLGRALGG